MTDSTHLARPCNPKEAPEPDNFPEVSFPGKGGGKQPGKKDRGRSGSVSQILSAGQSRLCGHFSHADCGEAFRAPIRVTERMRLIPGDPAGRQPFPCLSCIARGLPCLLGRPRSGELLPPLFTLAWMGMNPIRAVCFLWHFPSGNPWEVPVSRFHGTRCLVMSGLSSTPVLKPEQRPPEPDRHGLHTLSAARGKAQSWYGGHFCSLLPPLRSQETAGSFRHASLRTLQRAVLPHAAGTGWNFLSPAACRKMAGSSGWLLPERAARIGTWDSNP